MHEILRDISYVGHIRQIMKIELLSNGQSLHLNPMILHTQWAFIAQENRDCASLGVSVRKVLCKHSIAGKLSAHSLSSFPKSLNTFLMPPSRTQKLHLQHFQLHLIGKILIERKEKSLPQLTFHPLLIVPLLFIDSYMRMSLGCVFPFKSLQRHKKLGGAFCTMERMSWKPTLGKISSGSPPKSHENYFWQRKEWSVFEKKVAEK